MKKLFYCLLVAISHFTAIAFCKVSVIQFLSGLVFGYSLVMLYFEK